MGLLHDVYVVRLPTLIVKEYIDLNIILLDEPDSHIHRDIQKRLMRVLTNFSSSIPLKFKITGTNFGDTKVDK